MNFNLKWHSWRHQGGLLYSRVLVKVGLKQEMLYSSVMFCSCVAQIVICGTNMIHVGYELTLFAIIYN